MDEKERVKKAWELAEGSEELVASSLVEGYVDMGTGEIVDRDAPEPAGEVVELEQGVEGFGRSEEEAEKLEVEFEKIDGRTLKGLRERGLKRETDRVSGRRDRMTRIVADTFENMARYDGDNAKYSLTLAEIYSWGDVDTNNIPMMEQRMMRTLLLCSQRDIRLTNQALYWGIGIDTVTINNWEKGVSKSPEHQKFARKVKHFCAAYREMLAVDGKIHPSNLIWWQKNYDGFVDKSEVVINQQSVLGDKADVDEVKRRLIEGIADEE